MIDVQRTDFVAVPVQDRDRAAKFYGETLGLTKNPNSTESWIEFETGNTTLALVSPEHLERAFRSAADRLDRLSCARCRRGEGEARGRRRRVHR